MITHCQQIFFTTRNALRSKCIQSNRAPSACMLKGSPSKSLQMESAAPVESPLPATVEPDWKAIRERYLEGEEIVQIAADNNTTANAIYVRASREKWKAAQFERLLRDERLISNEVRNCLLVSVLKESRWFQSQDPSSNPIEADAWSKVRSRLVDTAAKLLHWDADPLERMKSAKALDV